MKNIIAFYNGLIRILAKLNILHMYFLEHNSDLIAGVFGYTENEIFHWAKTGYNEKYKRYSPSNLLLLMILEEIIENNNNVKLFHMFPWEYGYKHRYINIETKYFASIIYNNNLKAKIWRNLKKAKKKIVK